MCGVQKYTCFIDLALPLLRRPRYAYMGVSLQETEEFECWVEPASAVWTVGHVDSTHLITGPCVCIVMLDNGPAAAARQQEM